MSDESVDDVEVLEDLLPRDVGFSRDLANELAVRMVWRGSSLVGSSLREGSGGTRPCVREDEEGRLYRLLRGRSALLGRRGSQSR